MTYTYFLRNGNPQFVKIGKTTNVKVRLKDLQAGSPTPLEYIAIFDSDREAEFHERFKADHLWGEWFVFSAAMRAFLETEPRTAGELFDYKSFYALLEREIDACPLLDDIHGEAILKAILAKDATGEYAEIMACQDVTELRRTAVFWKAALSAIMVTMEKDFVPRIAHLIKRWRGKAA